MINNFEIHNLPANLHIYLISSSILKEYDIWLSIISGNLVKAKAECRELKNFIAKTNRDIMFKSSSPLEDIISEINIAQAKISVLEGETNSLECFISSLAKLKKESCLVINFFTTGITDLAQSQYGMGGRLKSAANFYLSRLPAIKEIESFPSFEAVCSLILSEIFYEFNKIDSAQEYAQTALKIDNIDFKWDYLVPIYFILCKIKIMQGQPYAALELLNILEKKLIKKEQQYNIPTLLAHKARIAIKMRDCQAVRNWVNTCQLTVYSEFCVLQHYQYLTLIRTLLYIGEPDKALILCERMIVLTEETGGLGQQIEVLILQALSYQALNRMDEACSL